MLEIGPVSKWYDYHKNLNKWVEEIELHPKKQNLMQNHRRLPFFPELSSGQRAPSQRTRRGSTLLSFGLLWGGDGRAGPCRWHVCHRQKKQAQEAGKAAWPKARTWEAGTLKNCKSFFRTGPQGHRGVSRGHVLNVTRSWAFDLLKWNGTEGLQMWSNWQYRKDTPCNNVGV